MKVPNPRKLPSGSWFIQLRLGGVSVPITAPTEKECRRQAEAAKAKHRAGETAQKRQKTPTLVEAIENYIAVRSNTLSPSSVRSYHTIKRNRFKSVMNKDISTIKNWQALCNAEAVTCSAKTLKNSYAFVATVLRENGIVAPRVTLPQVVSEERAYFEPEQIPLFLSAMRGHKHELPALFGLHGLRVSEICGLKWTNVDFNGRRFFVAGAFVIGPDHVLVEKKENKNISSRRWVPVMMPRLLELLAACEQKSEFVFSDLHPATLRKNINAVCEKNNLPRVGCHGLRHSFASLAYHLNMSEKVTMQIGGWADNGTMRRIYTHLAQKDLADGAVKMTDFFKNANKNANE